MELIHGGDWMGYREKYGAEALDFSANVSPLGMPRAVAVAIAEAAPLSCRYPDPLCRELRTAIAKAENIPAEHIICGNGAADLIYRLAWALKPRRALVTAPAFAEYEAALNTVGCEVRRYALSEKNDFDLTDDFLRAIDESVDIVFICQPNNPTGRLAEPELVRGINSRCAECGARLIIDECFLDFVPECEELTAKTLLADSPHTLILKAFTKLYGMAGVRLGYVLCADEALLEAMRAAGQPWAVSSLAQAAGVAALEQSEYVARVRALIAEQRPALIDALRALGLRVVEGRANYLLFRADAALGDKLKLKGIVLRSCANYEGLDSSWYRTAVRTGEENAQLIAAIREALK